MVRFLFKNGPQQYDTKGAEKGNHEKKRISPIKFYSFSLILFKLHYENKFAKTFRLLIFFIYSLNFSLEFFIMIFFLTNQLNISKFLPPQIRKTLIETKLHQFSKFLLIVFFILSRSCGHITNRE